VLTADARIGRVGWLVFVQSPISEALAPVYGALVSGITDDQLGQRPTSPTSDGRCWRASRVPAVVIGYLETAARRPCEFELLAKQGLEAHQRHPCHIATWASEARDEPCADWINQGCGDDWYIRHHPLSCDGRSRGRGHDQIRSEANPANSSASVGS
jgi:hypothetical protein